MSWEAIIGILVTVVVMPIGGYVVALGRRQNATDVRLTKVETDQTWIRQTLLKIETNQETTRKEVVEKLDNVVEHLLKTKGK